MIVNVLPGDSIVETFSSSGIDGRIVVCREAFVDGDLDGDTLEQFWETRANFVSIHYGGDPIEYREKVVGDLIQLLELSQDDEVNLWFEHELFCSVNMWFCLDLLRTTRSKIFRAAPLNAAPDDVWDGFGHYSEEDLRRCYDARILFSQEDVKTGSALWQAFRQRDMKALRGLSAYRSPCFPFLKEVCDAAVEIDVTPLEIVSELRSSGLNDLEALFPEFRKRAGVYGYGDSQVQRLLDQTFS